MSCGPTLGRNGFLSNVEIRILLSGEDEAHRGLGLFVIRQAASPDTHFSYVGIRPQETDFFVHQGVRELMRQLLKLPPGKPLFFDDTRALKGHPRATLFADIIRLAEKKEKALHLLVILEDTDGKPEIQDAIQAVHQWHTERGRSTHLVIGTPEQDAEAWIIAGLALDASISVQREKAKRQLKFDPCLNPEKLSHAPNNSDRDAKRVLAFLLGDEDLLSNEQSHPPDARHMETLLARSFEDFERVLKSDAARKTLLTPFYNDLRNAFLHVLSKQ